MLNQIAFEEFLITGFAGTPTEFSYTILCQHLSKPEIPGQRFVTLKAINNHSDVSSFDKVVRVAVRSSPELVLIQTDMPIYTENDNGNLTLLVIICAGKLSCVYVLPSEHKRGSSWLQLCLLLWRRRRCKICHDLASIDVMNFTCCILLASVCAMSFLLSRYVNTHRCLCLNIISITL